jgi:hypothetical protein
VAGCVYQSVKAPEASGVCAAVSFWGFWVFSGRKTLGLDE